MDTKYRIELAAKVGTSTWYLYKDGTTEELDPDGLDAFLDAEILEPLREHLKQHIAISKEIDR